MLLAFDSVLISLHVICVMRINPQTGIGKLLGVVEIMLA